MLSGLIRALRRALVSASGSVFALPPHRSAQRELLSQPASPGDTQDVGLLVAEFLQHLAQEQGQGGESVRQIG
jgi:hypothetical protein